MTTTILEENGIAVTAWQGTPEQGRMLTIYETDDCSSGCNVSDDQLAPLILALVQELADRRKRDDADK